MKGRHMWVPEKWGGFRGTYDQGTLFTCMNCPRTNKGYATKKRKGPRELAVNHAKTEKNLQQTKKQVLIRHPSASAVILGFRTARAASGI